MSSSVGKLSNHDAGRNDLTSLVKESLSIENDKIVLAGDLMVSEQRKKNPIILLAYLLILLFIVHWWGCDVFTRIDIRWQLSSKLLPCLRLVSVLVFRWNGCEPACLHPPVVIDYSCHPMKQIGGSVPQEFKVAGHYRRGEGLTFQPSPYALTSI